MVTSGRGCLTGLCPFTLTFGFSDDTEAMPPAPYRDCQWLHKLKFASHLQCECGCCIRSWLDCSAGRLLMARDAFITTDVVSLRTGRPGSDFGLGQNPIAGIGTCERTLPDNLENL
jgi:hypothetical protein